MAQTCTKPYLQCLEAQRQRGPGEQGAANGFVQQQNATQESADAEIGGVWSTSFGVSLAVSLYIHLEYTN